MLSAGVIGQGMRRDEIQRAAELLFKARSGSFQLERLPENLTPANLDDALEIQAELFQMLGGSQVGWFLGGTNGSTHFPTPYAAPILTGALHDSGAVFRKADFLTFDIDVEFGFTFGQELRPQPDGYQVSDILEAVESIHPTLDIVNAHFKDLERVGWPSAVADNGSDGVVVRGPGMPLKLAGDLNSIDVKLIVNGRHVLSGTGQRIMGNPVEALCWFVNDMGKRGQRFGGATFWQPDLAPISMPERSGIVWLQTLVVLGT